MRRTALFAAILALAACATEPDSGADTALERGRGLAHANCSSCHAVGATGDSPAPEAPRFRELSRNYRVDALEEALAEGISVGHPAMPQFQFMPDDVGALVQYLQ